MKADAGNPDGATPLEADEVGGLKFRHVTTRRELDELEQANIEAGLLWVARRRKSDILTGEFARTLHRRLFGGVWNWAGKFRLTEKNIGVDPVEIPVRLRMLLDDARYWATNGTYSPLEAAARFHHRLVQIHPFPNGNGRHARIFADILLGDIYGHAPIDWAAGENLQSFTARRNAYIAALRAADAGDYGLLFEFIGTKNVG